MDNAIGEHFQPSLKELSELEQLTKAYGKFSRDAAGLGHVLGGGLVFLSAYLLGRHVHFGILGRLLLGAAPFAWIFGKEGLRENYYQFSGKVKPPRSLRKDVTLAALTGITALFSLTAAGFVVYGLWQHFSLGLGLSSLIYIALLLPMPVLVWRYLRSPYEFVVGIFLLMLSAVLLSGAPLETSGRTSVMYLLIVPAEIVALVMVLVGIVEHTEFLKLRREMSRSKVAA